MSEQNGGSVATVIGAKPDPNRPTTQADVKTLIESWRRLSGADKAHKTAVSDLRKGLSVFSENFDMSGYVEAVEATATRLAAELVEVRGIIESLPNGTTGPGGKATRQTIILEFYGSVNRNLKARLSASDAKAINKASFGA